MTPDFDAEMYVCTEFTDGSSGSIQDKASLHRKGLPMFSIAIRREQHTRQYTLSVSQSSGWELTLQEDRERARRVHFDDWHRVERAVAVIKLEVQNLTASGWRVEHAGGGMLES